MSDGRQRYARMRSILEVPILNAKYWAKVPTVAADAIMIDLEDSAVPATKDAARAATTAWLERPEYFGGRHVIVRVNNLATPWARSDLEALADAPGDFVVCYPKIETADEIAEVQRVLTRGGRPSRDLHVMIETTRAVMELGSIAQSDGVVGLHYGYVDLAADMGARPFDDAGLYEPASSFPRAAISTAAAAYGLFATGGSLLPDYRDLDKVAALVRSWRDTGFTSCIAVSPTHLDLINGIMSPTADEVAAAQLLCAAFDEAVARGAPAAVLDGRVITLPDYRVAALKLARAGVSLKGSAAVSPR
jgi:citrate lyase beta subunit